MIAYKTPPRTGLEAYQLLPEGTLCQLINDHIIMSPAPLVPHQSVLQKINRQIDSFVQRNNLGEVLFAPVDVYLNETNVYQPDLLYVSNSKLSIIQEKGIMGAPDFIIEILSKGNSKYDKVDKKKVYESSGVKEYWLIDPQKKQATGFQLLNGTFEPLPSTPEGFTIVLIGLYIKLF